MKNVESSVARALFVFFASLPYAFFRIGYFVFTFPKRMRRKKAYKQARKSVHFALLSSQSQTLLSAIALIGKLNDNERVDIRRKPPSLFELAESLWMEDESEEWTLPSSSDVELYCEELRCTLHSALPTERNGSLAVWAIDEQSQTFVLVNLLKKSKQHATPENILTVLRGNTPESKERCFAFAVKKILLESTSPTLP